MREIWMPLLQKYQISCLLSFWQIVKKRIEGGANEKAVLRLFINCPFVCINFDFFLNDLQGTIPCPLHHNYYVFASTNLKLYNYLSNFPHFIGFPACPLVK